jgi:hypothetical protein
LPLLTYRALGGLWQDPCCGAESSAGAATCGNGKHDGRVVVDVRGGGDVEPVVGLTVWLGALGAEVRVCARPDWAERPADSSEGRQ